MASDDERHWRAAVYCASGLIRDRQLRGEPVPSWLRQHHAQCESALAALSRSGHQIDRAPAQLKQEMITAQEAADMLGCSKRQAQRLASDLDGQLVGGHVWVFSRAAVVEYAEGKRNAGPPSGC
jgi:hypothetical protein